MQEIRSWFGGLVALSGAIGHGRSILAAQALGADFAYIGSAWIATNEARAIDSYKQAIVASGADDIVYSNLFTGVHGNYLRSSIVSAGLDPDQLPQSDPSKMSFQSGGNTEAKAWKDIWGSGQGIGAITTRSSAWPTGWRNSRRNITPLSPPWQPRPARFKPGRRFTR